MEAPAHPARILEIHAGGLDWFAMLAGMNLDLFTPLAERPMRADELAVVLGVDAAKLSLLLYGLVVAGLLTVRDERFANTPETAHFLVRGKPAYMGGVHTVWAEIGHAGLKVAASVRTGVAQAHHDFAAMTEEALVAALGGLHAGAHAKGRTLAARYDFGDCRAVLDAGGGSGGVSIGLAEGCPHLHLTVADLPHILPVARRYITEAGLGDRIATVGCDLLREKVPGRFDAVVASYFFQIFSPDEARAALGHIAQSLRPGGTAYLLNNMLDQSRLTPAMAARLNVVNTSFYNHGQSYTEGEYRTWLAEAGFVGVTRDEDVARVPLIRAHLPG